MFRNPFCFRLVLGVVAVALGAPILGAAGDGTSDLEVESVVLRLLEEAEVPAQEAGVLKQLHHREGDRVERGTVLGQVDDEVARLALEAAERQFEIAQAEAQNDVRQRYAQKALEVSEAELRRSTESVERFPKSVSESQLDVERLTVQKNRLEAEQAKHETAIATLEMRSKQNELDAARAEVERRKIASPLAGVVVETFVREGEWVEPGERVLRIVGIDRLKAEGFLPAEVATGDLVGAAVRLTIDALPVTEYPGTIVFVSPEVDPITAQVRVWAEVDNSEGKLRPGLGARMRIAREPATP